MAVAASMAGRASTEIAEQILDLAQGRVEQAEVYAYDTSSTPADFESNRLKALETKNSRGVALRVVRNGRVGLASTTSLEDFGLLVDTAVELSAFGAEAKFELPSKITPTPVDAFDAATERVAVEQIVALGQEMIDRVRA